MWRSGYLNPMWRWCCLPTRIIRACTWEPIVKGNQSVMLLTPQKQSLHIPCPGLGYSQDLSRVPSVLLKPPALNQVFRERERDRVCWFPTCLGLKQGYKRRGCAWVHLLRLRPLTCNHGAVNVSGIGSSFRRKLIKGWERWTWCGNRGQRSSHHFLQLSCVKTHLQTYNSFEQ